ncbi:MAG: hypothetical protein WC444_04505 [Candidatus Paceibacterota bacterium]
MEYSRRTSGTHMGAVRRWIQTRFHNGDTVHWSSQEKLFGVSDSITPAILEEAAQVVHDAMLKEFAKFLRQHTGVCSPSDKFVPNTDRPLMCNKCGMHKDVHDLVDVLNGLEGSVDVL